MTDTTTNATPNTTPATPNTPDTPSTPKTSATPAKRDRKPKPKTNSAKTAAAAITKTVNDIKKETAHNPKIITPADLSKRLDAATKYIQKEVISAAQSFLRIGFKLHQIREEKLYLGGDHDSLYAYAEEVFKLQKASVCNYIAVCERFSEYKDGKPTEKLQGKYTGFSYGQLSLMLPIPDEKISEIKPALTCKEIRRIKKEAKAIEKASGSNNSETPGEPGNPPEPAEPAEPGNPPVPRVSLRAQNVYSGELTDAAFEKILIALKGHMGCIVNISVLK